MWNTSLNSVVSSLFLFFCLFPYVSILRIPTDAQPNALLFGLGVIALNSNIRYSKSLLVILLLILIAFVGGTIVSFNVNFTSFRSLLNYVSLGVIILATFAFFKRNKGVSWYFFWYSLLAYIAVSVIQLLWRKSFFGFLLYRVSTTEGRGVTGFAPEPTFNATIAVFFLVIYLLNFFPKKKKVVLPLIVLWVILLAKSTTIVLVMAATLLLFLLIRYPKVLLTAITAVFLLVAIGSFVSPKDSEKTEASSRMEMVIDVILYKPDVFLVLDKSVNDRISHIVAPVYIAVTDYFAPHGANYQYFNDSAYEMKNEGFPNLFFFDTGKPQWERIMSGWGMLFFECGLIGFAFFFYFIIKSGSSFPVRSPEFLAFLIFTAVMFTAVSISTAIVPFIMGNILYKIREQKEIC